MPTRPADLTAAGPSTSTRVHGLDALRATALGLGIVLHTLAPFLPGTTWFDEDPAFAGGAAVTVSVIHLFRMVLFMMLAGYFGRLVLQRRGAWSYARDRAERILLPLLVLSPVVLMSIIGVEEYARRLRGDPDPLPPLPSGVPFWLWLDPAHLWFLVVLVQSIAVLLLVRAVVVRLAGAERTARWASRTGGLLLAPAGVCLAAVPYLLALLQQGTARYGVHQPSSLTPELAPLTAYLGAFAVGWFLHARTDAVARLVRAWPTHLAVAVALTAVFVVFERDGALWLTGPAAAVAGWCWCYGLFGLFVQALGGGSPRIRYLADSAYFVFIAHLPVTAVVQLTLAKTGWDPWLQLLSAWAVSVPLLLLTYDLLVRSTWMGAWLGGRRLPRALRLPGGRRGGRSEGQLVET